MVLKHEVKIVCPECGNSSEVKVAWLEAVPDAFCFVCDHDLTDQLVEIRRALGESEQALTDALAKFRRGA